MTLAEAVRSISLFEGLADEQLERLGNIAVTKTYEKGTVIFEADTPANGFYAVLSGRVKIFRTSPSGKEQILHIFGAGESFAEVPVFEGTTFPVHAQTLEKGELLFVPRQEFARMISQDPDLAMEMMAQLSSRLRILVNKIEELSLKEAPSRVASYLLLLAASQEKDTIRLDLPKGQIAFYLGTIQETLSRILKRFVEDGIIEMQGKEITLVDKNALQEIADEGR
ncbi:Crp/Fnr family transcriptional regulator [Salidesulfovibrio onnuriiensis]|uniref:Crp/Fnr family transcriptional regulator n=1 Tax=Salidesulfovibrio onnuriiensis TaxID=2583823 RepID=UPI0011CCA983|nr:Crp/Fnr family transcriptional regulator [Salidesulfovibrio onnuriiensis]